MLGSEGLPGAAARTSRIGRAAPPLLESRADSSGMKTPQLDGALDKKYTLGLGSGKAAAVTPCPESEEEQTRQLHSTDSRETRANGWFGSGVLS